MRNVQRRLSWVALIALGGSAVAFAPAAIASDEGLAAAEQVSQASFYDYMDLWLYTHAGDDRGSGPEHDLAMDNIAVLMESYGLTVTLEPFLYYGTTYYNVVGTKVGTVYPDQEVIIGAHYDSVDNPGADDDASGVALVLEAARIITQYDSQYTIRFVAFDREEQGLIGSYAYVDAHATDDMQAMLQADMVAYDPGVNKALLYAHDVGLKADLGAAILEYGDGLGYVDGGWNGQSDHRPFDEHGVPACLLIESEVWNNPYYHTQQDNMDNPDNINWEFAVRMVRAAVGWLVDEAGVLVDVTTLRFFYPDGLPTFVDPAGGTTLRITVEGAGDAVPAPETGLLHYDIGNGWESVPLEEVGEDMLATFPAADCPTDVLYYVSMESTDGDLYTSPRNAPDEFNTAVAAYGEVATVHDNFETDQGWTAENLGASSGFWQRGVPVNDPNWEYDPVSDSDGSGQCYLTQNEYGNTDVDDGSVRLTSPVFDMSDGGMISYDYYLYLTVSDGNDKLLVEANNTGGTGDWFEVARHDTGGGLNWRHHVIDEATLIAAGVPPTAAMQIRYTASDLVNDPSIVEAGIDAFMVSQYDCGGACPADFDGDGDVDTADLLFLLAAWGTPDGDVDGDGDTDTSDLLELLAAWGDCPEAKRPRR
jgi:hypothetical protein